MSSMIQALMRPCFVIVAVAACQSIAPSYANDSVTYASATGSGVTCTAAAPCGNISQAFVIATNAAYGTNDIIRVLCLSTVAASFNPIIPAAGTTFEIDCPQGYVGSFQIDAANTSGTLRGVTFTRGPFPYLYSGSGTLTLENCEVGNQFGVGFDIEPTGPLNLVIRNSRISNNGSGILLKPAAGGSIHATFDHVTIAQNTGGGIKIDTTNGPVTADVTDSVVSDNGGNGINAIGNAGSQNVVIIKNSVITKNGTAGVQANGATVGVLVSTTLLDQNAAGATSIVTGGHIYTYSNNNIIGSIGSGFSGPAPLQ